ncbi:IQ and ubiquitin-like domain-containing protein [Rousettus aegyptiacus]|uniref:IQ motif and ubiquitin domain containing n=2 Tax=Rousettus aegyptiacus TaxID=9407 RepID=A0A7J8D621_ROUAE|nr:IQ and ubiquitin-like domain-containing protein [Rousettus aegyptiacus]XP_015980689.2 IQ and ubiquitin-like domain-containing protein [Rousettus aegyptiacus]XP_015980690.2 IQ and ubiquitin-like domain-containing protein [Rousettus aegyptiacus]XP_036086870.1 IQ and ubiquitin-like domain-containing protein [Rousettus aegyptiacus]KAF6418578.1 IQ motif and ubiquitin domain containing [Rousettus aegyptiacus]
MSEQEEEFDAQNALDAPKGDGASEMINIPAPSQEALEADQIEENESSPEPSGGGHETLVEEQNDKSTSNLEPNNEQLVEEIMSPEQVLDSPTHLSEFDSAVQSPKRYSNDSYLTFLDKIKAVKESLKTSMQDSLATVKAVLLPVGQEVIMSFKIDSTFKYLKDHFSNLLNVPPDILQIRYAGIVCKNNETLLQHGVKAQDVVQVEIFSSLPNLYPVRRISRLSDASQVLTVRVETGIDQYQQVAVEVIKSDFHKPFLGGFRHKITGIEYHNAGTQTVPKKIPEKNDMFCRDTQTVFQRKKLQQTTNTTSTQMTKIGVYVSNMTDKLIIPGRYFTAAEYHAQRLAAVIVLQTYYRQWHAKIVVENLRRQKMIRLQWEEQEELKKIREKEEWMKLDYYRRHNPQTRDDFELLYNALELWRQEEQAHINQSLTGAERKAALCELLEKETQLIASIGRHRYIAYMANQEALIQAFLDKCSAPKIWRRFDGKIVEMDTQFTIRARELQNIYKCIMLKNISQDERLDVLLTLKHTVKEHECKLTQEILELIDREVDLMMRGVKHCNLEGLRKRIATLFFHYIKTPLFNPEAMRHLKVPQDPLKFYKKIYFCYSCQLYLPSTEFAISSTSHRIVRCRNCISLDNETRQRESFLKYKSLLLRLYYSEANYEDDSKIAFLMQLQDIQYLTENIWSSQSVLSAWNDLNDLVMVRWDKALEWSPWNCILLTKDEGAAHLRLTSLEEGYEPLFIHKIKHKHILAKNYFSQIPLLASFMLDDDEINEIRKKYNTETTPKIIISQNPSP